MGALFMQRRFLSAGVGALGFLLMLGAAGGIARAADVPVALYYPPPPPVLTPANEYSFGLRYDRGEGVAQNYTYAAYWYRRAAADGDPRAQLALAIYYGSGFGVPRDLVVAYAWADIAAGYLPPGSPDWQHAVHYRKLLRQWISVPQMAEAQQAASDWRPGLPGPIEPQWPFTHN